MNSIFKGLSINLYVFESAVALIFFLSIGFWNEAFS